jgi:ATP-binding cassette subfamily F protein 1
MNINTTDIKWTSDNCSVKGLSIGIAGFTLFDGANFDIVKGEKIGVLGRNGSGKSTLFHYLSKHGDKKTTPWSVFEVMQELPPLQLSIVNVVLSADKEKCKLLEKRAKIENSGGDLTDAELEEYTKVSETLVSMKVDADKPRAIKILMGLGFSLEDLDKPLSTFSGGWRARVALTIGLFMEPDLLMLDEPTNHLDLNAMLWLTNFCTKWKKTLLIITHNTYFAQNVCNKFLHIENKRINSYKCSFDKFEKMRKQNIEKQIKDWVTVEKEYKRLRGKGTDVDKKKAEEFLAKKHKDGITCPEKAYKPRFALGEPKKYKEGVSFLEITESDIGYANVTEGTNKIVLNGVNFALYPSSKVVLVGKNGSGKSSFLKVLAGALNPLTGEVKRKPNMCIRYFNQHFYNDLPEKLTPIEYVMSLGNEENNIKMDMAHRVLASNGLDGGHHKQKISTLSGGQKARVYFAGISVVTPDILLLDEPTNHMDIETTKALLEGLKEFDGALIIVSHDINFLEELGTEVWVTEDNELLKLGEGIDGLEIYVNGVYDELESSEEDKK